MRASEQEQIGGAGASEVSGKFERIGWGPVRNETHDLGTDLLVQARDRRRFDRGLIVGVQVKAGHSRFDEPEFDEQGELVGWWYYEAGPAHFDDWVTHCLPHLLVLHDLEHQVSYWVHVTADRVVGTGKGCKIMVPAIQTIDEDHVDELLAVAAMQRASSPLEGTAWGASASSIPPGRRLRYALLAPRLVAPHRNVGHSAAISAEEALALCAQGRFRDLTLFAEQHAGVPDPRVAYTGHQWRWKLVHAFWEWAMSDDVTGLSSIAKSAPDPECRVTIGVLLSCALLRVEQAEDARDQLTQLVAKDDLGPIDQGWCLVQRARMHAQVGDIAEAQADSLEAQRQLNGDADDISASALAAAAAWILFTTAGFGRGDLGATLTASDTAIAWWRSQTTSSALSESALRAFRAWAHDTTTPFSFEDAEAINLFAAELNADLTGEHETWRAAASLRARQQVMSAHQSGDLADLSSGLVALRRSGDQKALKLAFEYLWRVGPVQALAVAVDSIGADGWTETTAQANLQALAIAGDLADSNAADARIEMLVEALLDPTEFEEQAPPSFLAPVPTAEAIGGLLPAATGAGRRRAAEYLANLSGPVDVLLGRRYARWIGQLMSDDLTDTVRDGLTRLGAGDDRFLGASALGWLAAHGDDQAKQDVQERALKGDLDALPAMGDVRTFSASEAEPLVQAFAAMVTQTTAMAAAGTFTRGVDAAGILALLNIWFPEVAQWDPLMELLEHPTVATNDKRGALERLVANEDRVPHQIRSRLAAGLDAIAAASELAELGGQSIAGLVASVGIVTNAFDADEAQVAIAKLVMGSEQDRTDAARLLGLGWCDSMRPLLAAFAADARPAVRSAAAHAVGRLASGEAEPLIRELAQRLAGDHGAVIPPALLAGLTRAEKTSEFGSAVAEDLMRHPSARVRRMANEFLRELS